MKRVLAGLGVLGLLGLGLAACSGNTPGIYTVPSSVPADCSKVITGPLGQVFAALPAGATVDLGQNACYLIAGPLTLQDKTNLTIHGNGATIKEASPLAGTFPVVNLWHDTNVTVDHLTIDGGSAGNGGPEGDYGVVLEGDNGVTVTNSTIQNTFGDWVYLSPPYDIDTETDQLNTAVTFNGDTFANAGYHGLTVESVGCLTSAPCNGLTLENSTLSNIAVDAMDFEYDNYSTGFQDAAGNCTPTPSNVTTCLPFWAAQDYVTIKNNVWNGWGDGDWLAAIQGQGPGVRFQHLTVTANTLNGNGAFIEAVGTQASVTTPPYLNSDWSITANHYGAGFYATSYRGGGSADLDLEGVYNLSMYGNHLADCPGGPGFPGCAGDLVHYAIQGIGVTGVVAGNDFTGNLGLFQPFSTFNDAVAVHQCWNKIGPWGAAHYDAPCGAGGRFHGHR